MYSHRGGRILYAPAIKCRQASHAQETTATFSAMSLHRRKATPKCARKSLRQMSPCERSLTQRLRGSEDEHSKRRRPYYGVRPIISTTTSLGEGTVRSRAVLYAISISSASRAAARATFRLSGRFRGVRHLSVYLLVIGAALGSERLIPHNELVNPNAGRHGMHACVHCLASLRRRLSTARLSGFHCWGFGNLGIERR